MIDYDTFLSRGAASMQESAIRKTGALGLRVPDLISFAPGFPAPEVFAWDEFRDVAQSVLDGTDSSVLQYGPTRGYRPLVEALPHILAERGIHASPEDMIVTTGSQQALDLCARVFIDPGDVVLVELPTYTGAITAFRNVQAQLVGVEQGADGIDVDDLDRCLVRERAAGRRVAFLYVVPNFQNPTGLLISLEKRRALLEWASRRHVLIVEDDPYGALHFDDVATSAETRPIKADDADGRVVYLSSFSKTVAPGFRVAWIAAPGPIVAKLEVAKQAADLCTGGLDQRIVYEVWKRGVMAARLPGLRAYYQQKRTVMEQALRRELGDLLSWPEPKGGFFLWASFPDGINTDAMLTRAIDHSVVYVAGSAFFIDGRSGNLARLSFSAPSAERIEEGIARLGKTVRDELSATASSQRRRSDSSESHSVKDPAPHSPARSRA
jgi:2-aminoadipate transaminase